MLNWLPLMTDFGHYQMSGRGISYSGEHIMDDDEVSAEVIQLLHYETCVPCRALKRRFDLDDDYIEALKIDIIRGETACR